MTVPVIFIGAMVLLGVIVASRDRQHQLNEAVRAGERTPKPDNGFNLISLFIRLIIAAIILWGMGILTPPMFGELLAYRGDHVSAKPSHDWGNRNLSEIASDLGEMNQEIKADPVAARLFGYTAALGLLTLVFGLLVSPHDRRYPVGCLVKLAREAYLIVGMEFCVLLLFWAVGFVVVGTRMR